MKTIMLILFPILLLAQEFMIQPNGSEPVVDPFTGDIYCRVFGEGIVKIRADGSGKVVNPFPHIAIPIFAHKTHKAFYVVETDNRDSTEIYLVDFENDTSYLFLKISFGGIGGISPNDKYMFLGGKTERYYSFEKDSIFDTGIRLNIQSMIDWINDSTIVYIHDENKIIRFCFTQGTLDTLIRLETGEYITGIAVNREKNLIAYGYSALSYNDVLIKFFHLNNGADSTVFDFGWISDAGPLQFVYLKWDTSFTRLAFLGDYGWLVTASDFFVFDYQKRKTFLYSEVHYGYKSHLKWLGADTLVYENINETGIFGFTLQSPLYEIPVGINNEINNQLVPATFQLKIYPNPFNSFTTIEFKNVYPGQLLITIFDVNGRLVLHKKIYTNTISNLKFLWNGEGQTGKVISSGIYYLIAYNITSQITYKSKAHKLVLVK